VLSAVLITYMDPYFKVILFLVLPCYMILRVKIKTIIKDKNQI
jgi:hypothetical protein